MLCFLRPHLPVLRKGKQTRAGADWRRDSSSIWLPLKLRRGKVRFGGGRLGNGKSQRQRKKLRWETKGKNSPGFPRPQVLTPPQGEPQLCLGIREVPWTLLVSPRPGPSRSAPGASFSDLPATQAYEYRQVGWADPRLQSSVLHYDKERL